LKQTMQILKSERGVSMPLALLLFLICATLAAVVLAAATASAGQATTLKESEQSYYAVTSAAKLFRDELNGQTIVIEQSNDSGSLVVDGTTVSDTNKGNLSVLERVSYDMMGSGAGVEWGKEFGKGTCTLSDITLTTTGDASSAVAVTVKPTVTSSVNGDVEVAFEFTQNAAGNDSYKLILTMTAYADEYEETDGDDDDAAKTRTTTVTWYTDELTRPRS